MDTIFDTSLSQHATSEHFVRAYSQHCCHLCHTPLREIMAQCPCPHWFVSACRSAERVRPVFPNYTLANIFDYLLCHVDAERARSSNRAWFAIARQPAGIVAAFNLNGRLWTFTLDGERRLTVALQQRKAQSSTSIVIDARQADVELLEQLLQPESRQH